jgi:hypothetical protein
VDTEEDRRRVLDALFGAVNWTSKEHVDAYIHELTLLDEAEAREQGSAYKDKWAALAERMASTDAHVGSVPALFDGTLATRRLGHDEFVRVTEALLGGSGAQSQAGGRVLAGIKLLLKADADASRRQGMQTLTQLLSSEGGQGLIDRELVEALYEANVLSELREADFFLQIVDLLVAMDAEREADAADGGSGGDALDLAPIICELAASPKFEPRAALVLMRWRRVDGPLQTLDMGLAYLEAFLARRR